MKKYLLTLFLLLPLCAFAQETPFVFESQNQTANQLPDPQKLPLGDMDTTAIVPIADTSPAPEASPLPPAPTPAPSKTLKKGFALGGTQDDLYEEAPLPAGTLAVYIDIEEAFNKNPWTLKARRGMRLDLETKQLEYAQAQQQLKDLRLKEKNLEDELYRAQPYFEGRQYMEAPAGNIYPKLQNDGLGKILNTITFALADTRSASPGNSPQKLEQLKENIKDAKKTILERESYLLNYKELSKEEVLSRQDYIVQAVLKEIYSGVQEYAKVRNIGIVVDKKDLIYGQPLDITEEFIKWMQKYHKKYIQENGDIL